jgi:hypothetical protein
VQALYIKQKSWVDLRLATGQDSQHHHPVLVVLCSI